MALIPTRSGEGASLRGGRPRIPWLAALGVCTALLLIAAPIEGQQEQHRRRGLWFSGGVGGGWNFTGTPQNPDARAGVGGYIRIGGTLSPYLLLGGETEWWLRDETESVRESRVNLTFTGLYYPWLDHGFYVRLGVGGAGAEFIISGSSNTWETGWGVTLGTGYDVTLGSAVSLTPNVDFLFQRVFDTNTTIIMFTLGITFP